MPRCFSNVASRASFVLPYASAGSISANNLFSSFADDSFVVSSIVALCFWMIFFNSSASCVSGTRAVDSDNGLLVVDEGKLMGDEPGNDNSIAGDGVVSCLVSCGISFCDTGRPSSVDSNCRSAFSVWTSFLFFSMSVDLKAEPELADFVFAF